MQRTSSSEMCFQRMKCQKDVAKILKRCESRDNLKSSLRSEHLKNCDKQETRKLSSNNQIKNIRGNGTCTCDGENLKVPSAEIVYNNKREENLENNLRGKYKLYLKLKKQPDNSNERLLNT